MIRFSIAQSGDTTATVADRYIHSRFDPAREASRFVDGLGELPGTAVIIGAGLGYITGAIRERRADCHTVAIHLSASLADRAVHTADHSWHPGLGANIDQFVATSIHPVETGSIAVIHWPAATRAFPEVTATCEQAISAALARLQAAFMTEGSTGRRWIRNTAINYRIAQPVVLVPTGRNVSACVIAAAGPTLERSFEVLAQIRDRVSLWALGSAVEPLMAASLTPDLVITTDAAQYATAHLRRLLAGTPERSRGDTSVAAPLGASRGVFQHPVAVLAQNDELEDLFLEAGLHERASAPAAGTVAATALRLALTAQPWPVVFAGLDLATYQLRSHARPHLSERYQHASSDRLVPLGSQGYGLSLGQPHLSDGWRGTRAFGVYSDWFRGYDTDGRVRRLFPSPMECGFPSIEPDELGSLPATSRSLRPKPARWPDARERTRIAMRVLNELRNVIDEFATMSSAAPWRALDENRIAALALMRLAPRDLIRWYQGDARALIEAVQSARVEISDLEGLVQ